MYTLFADVFHSGFISCLLHVASGLIYHGYIAYWYLMFSIVALLASVKNYSFSFLCTHALWCLLLVALLFVFLFRNGEKSRTNLPCICIVCEAYIVCFDELINEVSIYIKHQ